MVPHISSTSCIYRVPQNLRDIDQKAYTPKVVSIGPFHYGGKDFEVVQTQKGQFLKSFVSRRLGSTLSEYLQSLRLIEGTIRERYAERIELESDEFIKMILLDGCFILEFLLRRMPEATIILEDTISHNNWWSNAIRSDLILLENQLPFIVLDTLYQGHLNQGDDFKPLNELIYNFFSHMLSERERVFDAERIPIKDSFHLLDFVRNLYIPEPINPQNAQQIQNRPQLELPPNVTELCKRGVKLRVGIGRRLLDITFGNGVLTIPCVYMRDRTVSLFRNMIAFEELHSLKSKYITDYAIILNSFIDNSEDVALLCKKGIIRRFLGKHEQVSQLFKKLMREATIDTRSFCFPEIGEELNAYCRNTWHSWIANLGHTYCKTQWTVISVIGAFFVIFFAAIQAILAIRSAIVS
ncbi:hypothetical protein NE237_029445 [Protea cynaroides]|uniref:Uncharacterized protein n=1 Tax=Protea cynaroides TaxID=273540 RepID=A0A9Q0GTW9_9MAGN|nr:hypothetical protein NE237_029445 [Protea cynaroides]